MNAFSSLSADHQRLQALVGAWRGEEEVAATQWTDAGTEVKAIISLLRDSLSKNDDVAVGTMHKAMSYIPN
jgi:hypothetical protein